MQWPHPTIRNPAPIRLHRNNLLLFLFYNAAVVGGAPYLAADFPSLQSSRYSLPFHKARTTMSSL
eukprot:scaffold7820_cov99-Skeletonema_marinoi.AAC.4